MTKKRQAIVVSFSGVDGAGKSTQILSLLSLLDDRGVSSAVVSFWDQVVTLRGIREFTSHSVFRGEKGIGSPEKPVKRRDKNVQTRTMTLVRCFFYFLDALHTRLLLRRLRRDEFDVIVFDRYLYDELAN